MRQPREDTLPWYRQFWPWFLISLPAAAVVGGLVTVQVAVHSDDGLVSDDYYKEGLAIQRDAARAQMARQLGVTADLHYDAAQGAVEVELNQAAVGDLPTLTLRLFHPTRAHHDQELRLERIAPGRYRSSAAQLAPANWKLSLFPPSESWRINGRLSIPGQARSALN